jgi:hypothetical protein
MDQPLLPKNASSNDLENADATPQTQKGFRERLKEFLAVIPASLAVAWFVTTYIFPPTSKGGDRGGNHGKASATFTPSASATAPYITVSQQPTVSPTKPAPSDPAWRDISLSSFLSFLGVLFAVLLIPILIGVAFQVSGIILRDFWSKARSKREAGASYGEWALFLPVALLHFFGAVAAVGLGFAACRFIVSNYVDAWKRGI